MYQLKVKTMEFKKVDSQDKPFQEWLIELYNVTMVETRLSAYEIKINEHEAYQWYKDGHTPYTTFRETFGNEQDAGI